MSTAFLRTPLEKASYLAVMLSTYASGGEADESEYNELRSELLASKEITDLVPSFVRLNRNLTSFWHFMQSKFKTYRERRNYVTEQFAPLLAFLESGQSLAGRSALNPSLKLEVKEVDIFATSDSNQVMVQNKRKVFVVHGRDNEAKQEVARFITTLGLEPIILHEQASSGMTIIEKIERYTNDADFALVLYTSCDHGRGIHETNTPLQNRARQNVVFEHGYLMAKLGRENVCALVKGDIETPNDISGVVYVPLDAYGGWKGEVVKELQACGYTI